LFDSHCHPTDLEDAESLVEACVAQGIGLLACGYHRDSCLAVLGLRRRFPSLPVALGVHPWHCAEGWEEILAMIRREHPAAIGEVGLDGWDEAMRATLPEQRLCLQAQLQLALELGLPVTLHSRRALQPLQEVVRDFPGLRGALHAYGGSLQQAEWWLARGFYFGLGGAVTRPDAHRQRRLATGLPLDRLLLETDLPAIGQQGIAPEAVRPWDLRRVAETVATLRGVPEAQLVEATDRNSRALFVASR